MLGDPLINEILTREFDVQQQRILAALPTTLQDDETVRTALRGWIAFVRAVCLDWVERRTLDREQVRALCLRALSGLLEV